MVKNTKNIMNRYEKICKAIRDIREKNISIRKAAQIYGIPRTTLQDRLNGRVSENTKKSGPSPVLNEEDEKLLTNWCIELAKCGFPVKFDELATSVKSILDANKRVTPFVNNKPGRTWLKLFFKRNGILTEREAETISKGRAVMTKESIQKWFRDLEAYLVDIGHRDILDDPTRIYNGDETGFQMCPKSGKVISPSKVSYVYQVQNGKEKENITVLFVISADGKYAPPLVIFPYIRIPQNLIMTVPPEWVVGRSETGWMKSDVFYEYIANNFDPWLVQNQVKKPVILFVDGHSSHLNVDLSKYCTDNGIILYALPPNTTHMLQPADVSLFKPLKSCWKQTVREWQMQHMGEAVSRFTFCPLLEQVLIKKHKENLSITIQNGFRACGLFPFDCDAVDYTKCVKNNIEEITAKHHTQDSPASPHEHVENRNTEYDVAIKVITELTDIFSKRGIDPIAVIDTIKYGATLTSDEIIESIVEHNEVDTIKYGATLTSDEIIEPIVEHNEVDTIKYGATLTSDEIIEPIVEHNEVEVSEDLTYDENEDMKLFFDEVNNFERNELLSNVSTIKIEHLSPPEESSSDSKVPKPSPLVQKKRPIQDITNHLYYPKPIDYKKKRSTTQFPSAISSQAWRDIHNEKEMLKNIKKEPKPRGRPKRKKESEENKPCKRSKKED